MHYVISTSGGRLSEVALERQRRCGPYTSTLQLATCIQEVKRQLDDRKQHPAKLGFQGVRNFINQEMQQLEDALTGQFRRLKLGGRAVVITFKPSEEAVLERWLRRNEDGWASPLAQKVPPEELLKVFPLLCADQPYAARRVAEPVRPSHVEIQRNTRCRSAMVHILVKEARRAAPPGLPSLATAGPYRELALVRPQAPLLRSRARSPSEGDVAAGASSPSLPLGSPVAFSP